MVHEVHVADHVEVRDEVAEPVVTREQYPHPESSVSSWVSSPPESVPRWTDQITPATLSRAPPSVIAHLSPLTAPACSTRGVWRFL